MLDLLKLFFGNLLTARQLRIFRLGVVNELVKGGLISGLLEKVFNLLV